MKKEEITEGYFRGFKYSDPSFGLIRFSRVSGNRTLFQSSCDLGSFIELTIDRAYLNRHTDTMSDYVHSEEGIIRLSLSNAQFAELITNMNVGSGVPCTINYDGEKRLECPTIDKKIDIYHKHYNDRIDRITDGLQEQYLEIESLLSTKGSPTKKKLSEVRSKLSLLLGNFKSNNKFYKKCFKEDADKIVSDSKIEVESFISMHMHNKGVEAIEAMKKVNKSKKEVSNEVI
jgi:ElaB/YqjD/DUF883 family membrane-anchored ribosome-binding protein